MHLGKRKNWENKRKRERVRLMNLCFKQPIVDDLIMILLLFVWACFFIYFRTLNVDLSYLQRNQVISCLKFNI